MNAFPN